MDPSAIRKAAEENLAAVLARIHALTGVRGTRIRERLKSVPNAYKTPFMKAVLRDASPKQAIKAYCQNCVGYEDTKNQVGDCHAYDCPLWAYRPYQNRAKTE